MRYDRFRKVERGITSNLIGQFQMENAESIIGRWLQAIFNLISLLLGNLVIKSGKILGGN